MQKLNGVNKNNNYNIIMNANQLSKVNLIFNIYNFIASHDRIYTINHQMVY